MLLCVLPTALERASEGQGKAKPSGLRVISPLSFPASLARGAWEDLNPLLGASGGWEELGS